MLRKRLLPRLKPRADRRSSGAMTAETEVNIIRIISNLRIKMKTAEFPQAQAPSEATISHSLNVAFHTNGAQPELLRLRIEGLIARAIEDWGLEGNTGAAVMKMECVTHSLSPMAAKLDEKELSTWFSRQIEDGHMDLERIPALMARYALGNPSELREEFAERMAMMDDDNEQGPHDSSAPA